MGFAFFYAKNEKGKKIKRNFKKALDFSPKMCIIMMLPIWRPYAGMAELADALDSGSSESNFMEVQVLLPAPKKTDEFSLVGLFTYFLPLCEYIDNLKSRGYIDKCLPMGYN